MTDPFGLLAAAPAPNEPGGDPWLTARLAALRGIIAGERALYRKAMDMFTKFTEFVKPKVVQGKHIDPAGVFAGVPLWRKLTGAFVHEGVAPILRESYNRGRRQANAPDIDVESFHALPYTLRYLDEVQNKLVRVPDELFNELRTVLKDGTKEGVPIPDLAEFIEKELLNGNAEVWKNRGVVVARTEVIGANNGGQFQAFQDLGKDIGDVYVKRWLATHDHRTRATHRVADGQTVPIAAPFTVGGFPAMFPGEKTLPPQESIQCRCSVLYLKEGEEVA
jgi:hypothetical protein